RAGMKNNSTSFIFEIAKSEIGYTKQQPSEFAAVIVAAAVKEGYEGPVFVQGDHFQLKASNYFEDGEKEVNVVKELISKAIAAGFYNIDIDSSTLVLLDKPDLDTQQKHNYEQAAALTQYIRDLEPKGVTISVGGEIGEVGKQNSTVEELKAYMDGYKKILPGGMKGISKISVQTGTSHGGVPLADGTIAEVALDFDTLTDIGATSRSDYGISGAVQHGASTLPDEAFDRFSKCNTSEIHLATGFQNMIYDMIPADLKDKVYGWIKTECAGEKNEKDTEDQFIYKTRKKGFGAYKKDFWDLPAESRAKIGKTLEDKFDFLFKQLNAVNTKDAVAKHVKLVHVKPDVSKEIAAA
ncbi:MAG: class II fructose-bisphosphate aldolase, partial [Nitrospinota bacterium]